MRGREVLGGGVLVGTSGAAALVLKVLLEPFKVTSRERSAGLALSKLFLDPLRIEAVGISLSTQGFQRLTTVSHWLFVLPLYLQALSLQRTLYASGAKRHEFKLPIDPSTAEPTIVIDASTAAALRWLKIGLK